MNSLKIKSWKISIVAYLDADLTQGVLLMISQNVLGVFFSSFIDAYILALELQARNWNRVGLYES